MIGYASFKRLLRVLTETGPEPTYVAVKPSVDTRELLVELAEVVGLSSQDTVPERDLHATVTYSRDPIDDPSKIVDEFMPVWAEGNELAFFETRSGKSCLVLKLSSVGLRAMHEAIKRTGASHDFPTFEAHVTLCYDCPDDVRKRVEENKNQLNLWLTFDEFEVKPLEP